VHLNVAAALHPVLQWCLYDDEHDSHRPCCADPEPVVGPARGYLSRARGDDDPEVVAARQALASWRCRRVIDAEAGQIGAGRSRRSDARLRGFKDEAAPSHAP